MERPSLESPLIPSYEDDGEVNWRGGEEVVGEVKRQFWLAGPLIASTLLQNILQVSSVMFVGHLGSELSLSAASMATSFANVTGFTVLSGMSSALETLCGQAFGAKQYDLLGIHMQRAMLVLTLVSIPLATIWAFSGEILTAFHQDQQISAEAGIYARWMIPALFGSAALQCQTRFLQAQNIVFPLMLSAGVTALVHIVLCWILVLNTDLGIRGAAMANSISCWVNALLLFLYVKVSPKCRSTWSGVSRKATHDVLAFVKLAIPSAAMFCLEFWSFESIVLLSGLLPNPKLETSVTSISLNTSSMVFAITLGLGAAVSIRVSNELGAGKPEAARMAVAVAASMVMVEGLVVGTIMILGRSIWGQAFSNEREVVQHVASMLPLVAVVHFIDGTQCVFSGTARGCGWQKICAFVNLGTFYTVGIPSSILLAFVLHVGSKGLWMGIIIALLLQDLILLVITLRTDWNNEVKKARDRVYKSAIPIVT